MRTNITVFKWLDDVRHLHGIKDEVWATASDIRRPTISELRRIFKNPNDKVGRACTIEKISALYNGLHKLIGGNELKKHLEECLSKELDQDVRLMMLSMALRNADKSGKDLVEKTIRMVIKANEEKGK
jgi:hypothetical protein